MKDQKINLEMYTDEYVLSEIEKLRYTYGVNKVIRYNLTREEKYQTQSVAEHVNNMLIMAHYFRDLEDPEHKLDFPKIVRMILMHDMGEIETGDIIMSVKTKNDSEKEAIAIQEVVKKSPNFIAEEIMGLFEEFETLKTPEAKFAKAIDKIESQIFWFSKEGAEMIKEVHFNRGRTIQEGKDIEDMAYNRELNMFKSGGFFIIARFIELVNKTRLNNNWLD
jgi:5'-deoxynucleotidase YfbR-like HD superfamily hydrolase